MGIVQYDSRNQDANYQWYATNIAKSQYGGGAYGLRLISSWTPKLTTRFLVAYNDKGVNGSLAAIGGVGSKPEVDVYTTYSPSAGTLVGQVVTPGSTSSLLGKTFDPQRHQGYVREWLVGYRTQLPGELVVDVSYIDREYRDRPAQYDTNQIYTATASGGTVWSGLVNPALNNTYYVTNNKWNWFVYQGYEITVSKQTRKLQLFSTYTYSPDHLAGTFQPYDPTAIIEPTKFADNSGLGSVRGNVTNDWTGDTRDRMWQRSQSRTGVTWRAPWKVRLSTTITAQSGTPGALSLQRSLPLECTGRRRRSTSGNRPHAPLVAQGPLDSLSKWKARH
jgi:hypothetical protein